MASTLEAVEGPRQTCDDCMLPLPQLSLTTPDLDCFYEPSRNWLHANSSVNRHRQYMQEPPRWGMQDVMPRMSLEQRALIHLYEYRVGVNGPNEQNIDISACQSTVILSLRLHDDLPS